jgi:hypothetical protein
VRKSKKFDYFTLPIGKSLTAKPGNTAKIDTTVYMDNKVTDDFPCRFVTFRGFPNNRYIVWIDQTER